MDFLDYLYIPSRDAKGHYGHWALRAYALNALGALVAVSDLRAVMALNAPKRSQGIKCTRAQSHEGHQRTIHPSINPFNPSINPYIHPYIHGLGSSVPWGLPWTISVIGFQIWFQIYMVILIHTVSDLEASGHQSNCFMDFLSFSRIPNVFFFMNF